MLHIPNVRAPSPFLDVGFGSIAALRAALGLKKRNGAEKLGSRWHRYDITTPTILKNISQQPNR